MDPTIDLQPVHAGLNFAIFAAISIGLSLLARVLYKPKAGKMNQQDQPTTLATRGEYVNYVIGTQKTGHLFALTWGKRSRSSQSLGRQYFEAGFHAIGLGPAVALWQILENDKVIWRGPITPQTHPSGTSISISGQGTIRIYWGEDNQPLDPTIHKHIPENIKSHWPHLFYVVWTSRNLKASPIWGQIEYVWTAGCSQGQLTESPQEIGGYPEPWPRGINHAHALYQLLTAPFPWGVNIPPQHIDRLSFEKMGKLMFQENIGMNQTLAAGEELKKVVDPILLDTGVAMPQFADKLLTIPQRPPADLGDSEYLPDLSDDFVTSTESRRKVSRSESEINVPVFTFVDQKGDLFEFRTSDVSLSNDASISDLGSVKAQRVEMDTISHGEHAVRVAQRREQESAMTNTTTLQGLHAARMLLPGMLFSRNGDFYRVTSIRPSFAEPHVEIEATLDAYSVSPIPERTLPPPAGEALPLEPDLAFYWLELDPSWTGLTQKQVIVLRTRAHDQVDGAFIWASAGGGDYFQIGEQDSAAGGLIESDLLDYPADPVVDYGPVFEDSNGDAQDILDLTGDSAAWNAGVQLAIINQEIFFLRNVDIVPETPWSNLTPYSAGDSVIPPGAEATGLRYVAQNSGTSDYSVAAWPTVAGATFTDGDIVWEARHFKYQLRGMIRAQWGTVIGNHIASDRVYIIQQANLTRFEHPTFTSGQTLCIKSLPYQDDLVVDESSVSPICDGLSV